MKKFEVQEYTICDGWTNTWHEWDDDNKEIPLVFDSYEEALDELHGNIHDIQEAWNIGDIDSPFNPKNYRIVEVQYA